jgi:mannosylglycerate hydrolase MGH1-like protein
MEVVEPWAGHARARGDTMSGAEAKRLEEDARRERNWKRWGPYLSERQWGTVREDYSEHGTAWDYFPHDHARSRAYRWGEDGLLGITDRECRLCFALALWNGRDSILKERLFGLTGSEGNHGEDVKECYFYLDGTPTHSYLKALYKYPQAEFPYARICEENRRRGREQPEFELTDTGVFDQDRYFDVTVEYAKASPDDVLVRITAANRSPEAATLHLLPTVWYRNTWAWGRSGEGYWPRPRLARAGARWIGGTHASLGDWRLAVGRHPDGNDPTLLFTENETNTRRLFGADAGPRHTKDAFHAYLIGGDADAIDRGESGTKAAAHYRLEIPAGGEQVVRLRLTVGNGSEAGRSPGTGGNGAATAAEDGGALGAEFDEVFAQRLSEADEFYAERLPESLDSEERSVARQGYAGLLWSKQFYHYAVGEWLEGDPAQPSAPEARKQGRNRDWIHLYNRDVISMPDTWEYPWYAAWDLAFHMIPFANLDPHFAREQLLLFLREWYMHPNGQIPAYEWALGDVNPPVHAWAAWRVYKLSGRRGGRDRMFLERAFQKLLINFTWWVNRKDEDGHHIFSGGFLGLDNIGVFDRSQPLPTGGHLEQADGTAWMAFYCGTMLSIALELARDDPAYEDVASKFFEHFVAIVDAMNQLGGMGLWDEQDGFYYDHIHADGGSLPMRLRSMVGLIPLIACEVLEQEVIDRLPGFAKRMRWFLENRRDLARHISYMEGKPVHGRPGHRHRLLAIPSRERLERVLRTMLDEREFLSPHGIRSLSRVYEQRPYVFTVQGMDHTVEYVPGESRTELFGGNSNWRGPIWFPVNYLLIESLERYHHFYGDTLRVECPTGSGQMMNLLEVSQEIASRLARLFLRDAAGRRPCHGDERRYMDDPHWRDLVLFHEYFHGDHGRGVGASHQTGWTALAIRCLEKHARRRTQAPDRRLAAAPAAAP